MTNKKFVIVLTNDLWIKCAYGLIGNLLFFFLGSQIPVIEQRKELTDENAQYKHWCYICRKNFDRLSNYVWFNHWTHLDILALYEEGVTSKQRRIRSAELTKDGDHKHYQKLKEAGVIQKIPVRKGKKEPEKLQLCPHCKGFFANLSQHNLRCSKKEEKALEAIWILESDLLELNKYSEKFLVHVVGDLRDDLRDVIINDVAIMAYANLNFKEHKESIRFIFSYQILYKQRSRPLFFFWLLRYNQR